MTPEIEKLRGQIGGPGGWVYVEKFKVLTLLELWLAALDVVKYPPGTPAGQRALNELRRVVEKLG